MRCVTWINLKQICIKFRKKFFCRNQYINYSSWDDMRMHVGVIFKLKYYLEKSSRSWVARTTAGKWIRLVKPLIMVIACSESSKYSGVVRLWGHAGREGWWKGRVERRDETVMNKILEAPHKTFLSLPLATMGT